MKVLFVCLGNICRSPMAEAIFRHFSQQENLNIEFDSAGLSSWHQGEPPHKKTQEVLISLGIDPSSLRSRPITKNDFTHFDIIIGMDKENVSLLQERTHPEIHSKIFLYLDILPEHQGQDVLDPWYTGNFEETKKMILKAYPAWIEKFKEMLIVT